MEYQDFRIDFSTFKISGNMIHFPFEMVMRTRDRSIETYCFTKWNRLMSRTNVLTQQEVLEQRKMERYIKNELLKQDRDLESIHKFFYDKNWMQPAMFLDKLTSINLYDFDCKIWTNPDSPFLEIKGEIIFDMGKAIDLYIKRRWFILKRKNNFVKEQIELRLMRPFPTLVTYMSSPQINEMILNYIYKKLSLRNEYLVKQIERMLKIKDFHKMKKKEIRWVQKNIIEITINDFLTLLGIKTRKNILPLTAAGFLALTAMGSNKEK